MANVRRKGKQLARLLLLFPVLNAAACSSDTAILLEIDTDLSVPGEMDGVRIIVSTTEKQLLDNTYALSEPGDIPATLNIRAINDKEATIRIEVFGMKGKQPVAWGETQATFVKGETVDAKVFLTRGVPEDLDGGADAARDASHPRDAGLDASDRSDTSYLPDLGEPDTAPVDAGPPDAAFDSADPSDSSDPSDAGPPDAAPDAPDAGPEDAGAQIGWACDLDAGCGGGLECYQDFPGGYCTLFCPPECPEGSMCMVPPGADAGVCTRSCKDNTDCVFREGFTCLSAGGDNNLCSYPPDGGSSDAGSGSDTGVAAKIVIETNPPVSKVGIGDIVQFSATYFDETGAKVEGVELLWNSSPGCIWFGGDPQPGKGSALRLGACIVTASANGVTGEYPIFVYPVVSTFVGTDESAHVDGTPDVARFEEIVTGAMNINDQNIYVADSLKKQLRRVDSFGNVETIWDHSFVGCTGGPFDEYHYTDVSDIAPEALSIYWVFSDGACNKIERSDGSVVETVFSSTGKGYVDGDFSVAQTRSPGALATAYGGIFFSDIGNFAVRLVNTTKNSISTYAGSGVGGHKDGPVAGSLVSIPNVLFHNDDDSLLYFLDQSRVKTSDGTTVVTIAGGTPYGYKDGPVETAEFRNLRGIFVSQDGEIFLSDPDNHVIRYIYPDRKTVTTIAGGPEAGFVDGLGCDARFVAPGRILQAFDWQHLFVLDKTSIRKLKVTGP
jgi:hypothetical protein